MLLSAGIDPEKLFELANQRHNDGGVALGWLTVIKIVEELRGRADLQRQLEEADKMHTAYCCVLDHATGVRMSKAYYDWEMVCRVIDEHVDKQIKGLEASYCLAAHMARRITF